MAKHAAYFAVVFNDLEIIHGADGRRRANETLHQCQITSLGMVAFESFGREKVGFIKRVRVAQRIPAGKSSELAADALGTPAAVGLFLGLLVRVHATHALLDQMAAPRIADQIHNLGLGYPEEGVLDRKRLVDKITKQAREAVENLRMGRARRPRTDYLFADGQVQANDSVLIEPNVLQAEHVRDRSGEGSVQEGAAALRVLTTIGPALMNPHRDMDWRILFADRMQTTDQLLLAAEHFGV